MHIYISHKIHTNITSKYKEFFILIHVFEVNIFKLYLVGTKKQYKHDRQMLYPSPPQQKQKEKKTFHFI